jgi:hypothetical protein
MIRPATFPDLEGVKALLREMYDASKYRGHVAISKTAMDGVLAAALMAQRSPVQYGSFFHVALSPGGKIVGFMIGQLDRIYHIGNRLVAQDMYLYVSPRGKAADTIQLVNAYIAWAEGNQKVLDIKLSWTDTLPGAARVEKLYERKGFRRCGAIWERWTEPQEERVAA